MGSWTLDISAGEFFLDFAWMGLLLVLATWLRSKISILQKYLIPANLIAGAIGLLVGANLLGLIDLTSDRLGAYVYHLLALLFIALGLRAPKKKVGLSSVKFGLIFISVYLLHHHARTFCGYWISPAVVIRYESRNRLFHRHKLGTIWF
jgi:glutamate:Na+ symporter, ESS family